VAVILPDKFLSVTIVLIPVTLKILPRGRRSQKKTKKKSRLSQTPLLLLCFLIPASGFNTQAAWTSSNFVETKLRPVPPLGAVLNSSVLLDDAGIKPAGTIHTYRKQPSPAACGGVVDSTSST
jgi:hypothetical protein